MKKFIFILLTSLALNLNAQLEVGGVKMPYTLKTDETTLLINGAGIREKYFMDLYVGALYLKAKNNDADKIINANEAMCIKLHIVSGLITSQKMIDAVDEGFKKSTNNNVTPILSKVNQFKAVFNEKINVGDIYDLVYESAKGILIYKNNKLATTIPGLDFKKALFGIWLCNKPADSTLKDKMLGK